MAQASKRVRAAARTALSQPGLLLAALVLMTAVAWAVAPDAFTSRGPLTVITARPLQPPGSAAWFGTDYLGRDIYSRVVHGTALSLRAPVVAVGIALLCGTSVGLAAGCLGDRVDSVLMRVVDVLLAIPGILVSLAVVTALGFGTAQVAVAVGVAGIAGFARLTRAQVLKIRREPYVEATLVGGVRRTAVILTHVLPNAWGPVVALAALELGTAILSVSTLSFLGLGAQPPTPEWGAMVAEGQNYLATSWWLTALPGLTLVAVTLSVNRLARAAQIPLRSPDDH